MLIAIGVELVIWEEENYDPKRYESNTWKAGSLTAWACLHACMQ